MDDGPRRSIRTKKHSHDVSASVILPGLALGPWQAVTRFWVQFQYIALKAQSYWNTMEGSVCS